MKSHWRGLEIFLQNRRNLKNMLPVMLYRRGLTELQMSLKTNIWEENQVSYKIIKVETREMLENDVKIAIDTINEFTENMTFEGLNTELNSRIMMSDGDEFIQSDVSTPLSYFEIWDSLRNIKRRRVNR